MRRWLVPLLMCPKTGVDLELADVTEEIGGDVIEGKLVGAGGVFYPIHRGIPRFVKGHYASGFGLQWNQFSRTQHDDAHHSHSAERFWGETGFSPERMRGRLVLDGGCGAGRFTEIAARAGARVVAVDLSEAVEATYANNRDNPEVCVVQGSLLELPLKPCTFDIVFTIGVIQHTPDPLLALRQVVEAAKVGGEAGISWYKRYWYTYIHQKYWLRPFFKRMDEKRLFAFIARYVPKLLPVSRLLAHLVPDGELIDRILPVANRDNIPGLTKEQQLEWSILDTYDWFQPKYDLPQPWRKVERVLREAGFRYERAPLRRRGLHGVRETVPDSTATRRKTLSQSHVGALATGQGRV